MVSHTYYGDVITDIFFFEDADGLGFKIATTFFSIILETSATLRQVKFQTSPQDLTSFVGISFRQWSICHWDDLPKDLQDEFSSEEVPSYIGLKISTDTAGDFYILVGRRHKDNEEDKILTVDLSERNLATRYIVFYHSFYI